MFRHYGNQVTERYENMGVGLYRMFMKVLTTNIAAAYVMQE